MQTMDLPRKVCAPAGQNGMLSYFGGVRQSCEQTDGFGEEFPLTAVHMCVGRNDTIRHFKAGRGLAGCGERCRATLRPSKWVPWENLAKPSQHHLMH